MSEYIPSTSGWVADQVECHMEIDEYDIGTALAVILDEVIVEVDRLAFRRHQGDVGEVVGPPAFAPRGGRGGTAREE